MPPKPRKASSYTVLRAGDAFVIRPTFMHDCDHAVDAVGHRSYTVTKRGNFFADK